MGTIPILQALGVIVLFISAEGGVTKMTCIYHQCEETVETCTLCLKSICVECLLLCQEMGFKTLCPKCLRTMTGCMIELDDRVDR